MTLQNDILNDLIRDEGIRLHPYRDTVGKLTIGIGRNLDDNGISRDEAEYLCRNDIQQAELDLHRNLPWLFQSPEPVQRALINMCFNLGWPRLSRFKRMLLALEKEDYLTAANEALDSRWAHQVGDRAVRLSRLIREA